MKTFTSTAAQGDLLIRRVQSLPHNLTPVVPEAGAYIVAHSETGHHHVVTARPNVRYYDGADPLVSYLEVIEATDETETLLEHLRGIDTHEAIKLPVGIYEMRRQREHTPEGWRRVAD